MRVFTCRVLNNPRCERRCACCFKSVLCSVASRAMRSIIVLGARSRHCSALLEDALLASSSGLNVQQARWQSARSSPAVPDWTSHSTETFSLQPSYFSPLYSTYKLFTEKNMRRQLAAKLLMAHNDLSNEIEGYDAAQTNTSTKHRIKEMQRLVVELRALSQGSNLPSCTNRKLALGFYSMLEEESTGRDLEAEAFHATMHGQDGNVWNHWKRHFSDQYAGSPSMEPLHVIYSRDGRDHDQQQQGLDQDSPSSRAAKTHNPFINVTLTKEGMARAVGLRKSSTAHVNMARGQGRMFINGKPYDEALKDPGLRLHVLRPLFTTGTMGRFDVVASVSGGGPSAMAQALQHGIAQCLAALLGSHASLKGMVQRDVRRVERKKPGRVKARKGFAYVRR